MYTHWLCLIFSKKDFFSCSHLGQFFLRNTTFESEPPLQSHPFSQKNQKKRTTPSVKKVVLIYINKKKLYVTGDTNFRYFIEITENIFRDTKKVWHFCNYFVTYLWQNKTKIEILQIMKIKVVFSCRNIWRTTNDNAYQ